MNAIIIDKLCAQSIDTVHIKTIDIMGNRSRVFSTGSHNITIDSTAISSSPHQSIAELLSSNSSVFIKTYSQSGSATISARGTEARHNAVLWNGFNINSSSLGLTDLSIVPSFSTDKITLVLGGSGPVNGNSALGSTLILDNNDPIFIKHSQLGMNFEIGSFGNIHGGITFNAGTNNLESKTTTFYDAAENDFEYVNFTQRDKPLVKQNHAKYRNYGLLQNFNIKIKPNQLLTAGLWYQVTDRELPPLMTSPESHAEQRDSILRVFAAYKIVYKNSVLKLRGAYFREFQFYDDARQNLALEYLVNNYLSEAEWRTEFNSKIIWNLGVSFNQGEASFDEYHKNQFRSTLSVFTGLLYQPTIHWTINLNFRQEFTNIQNPPLSPSLGMEGLLVKKYLRIFGNIGRHYNLPSMNDLYWVPGGNENLLPENAWSEELGLILFDKNSSGPEIVVTAFNSVVENWIKWQPANGGIYSPDNLREVHCRGIESTVNYTRNFNELFLKIILNYTWCRSSLSKAYTPAETTIIDKQLIYVPENVLNGTIYISYHGFSLNYNHTVTGVRYTTSDNTSSLDAFQVANISIEKTISTAKFNIQFYGKISNLYDAAYQVIAYRPMPGRWFSAGIKLGLEINKHKS